MEFAIADKPAEFQVDKSFAAPSTTMYSEQRVLEEFLAEMNVLDSQPASSNARKLSTRPPRTSRSPNRSNHPYKKPNPVWKRRKEELQNLRSEVQALETQVAFLRLRETHAKLYDVYMETTEGQERWKVIAMRERHRSHQSQQENSQLKSTIRQCKKTCDALQVTMKMVDFKTLEHMTNHVVTVKSLRIDMHTGHKLQFLRTAVFNMLEDRMSARLNELMTVLREPTTAADTDQVQVYQKDCSKTISVVEFTRKRMLPFSAEKTSGVAWDIMKLGGFPNEQSAPAPSDDVLASGGYSSHPLKCGGTADLRTRCLKKRIAIPGGFAVLVESVSEWLATPASSASWSYLTRDTGWALVYPLETNGSSKMCRVQTMLRLTTADSDEIGLSHHKLQTQAGLTTAVEDVVIPFFREMMNSRHQLLDNALLDQHKL